MPYILGLTGNIASGKTTVGLMLLELGLSTYIDADNVVHELYLPGQALPARLAEAFGPGVLDADGGVDRRALGAIVFNQPERLRQLESIVHPAVQEALLAKVRGLPADAIGALDAIKLVESGYAPFCHGLWIVTCPEEIQLQRLTQQRGLSVEEARARLAAQPPIEAKLPLATAVIHNDGSLDSLRQQVTDAWRAFMASLAEQRRP
ncbi:MAG TPA: dephospho-CoA kinase [Ktedonobacterales bacterium]|jgi:dephospho-CoA kinase|nr:dephospho-CoA kinase [Ktedonobacterales bacterium]